ncbi:peptidoglycan/LPS O-acetylase OafA/YrhL [Microbacterium sp. BE35]|uniref:acyltransferase family protein n=1 Tax=Microbacterium sp. BE35 TaxID=2817773 RepID=UPI0028670977|nr:acyltransferase family protein [Microbacterium sp. BE35]MDR7189100.1 peptidoglycan/LPS O-acetylase OafA/YrhL [Microbacterium sp. BE35]
MTALTPLAAEQRRQPQRSQRFRPDIQALRALAIVLVVVDHLWPTRLPGGYVGVDVFFVISGFLITAHLFSEVAATGRIRLGQFYARRIRRLLPAALLVLAVSGLLVAVFLPSAQWQRNAAEVAASAGYVENWLLAALSVNYSAVNDAASVAQHYWSLSVEEQFYLVWPIVLLAGLWVVGRGSWPTPSRRRAAFGVLSVIAVLSLAASVAYTVSSPSQAYFATFTRAWEFAFGGLIALSAHRFAPGRVLGAMLAAVGFAAILAAAVWFGPQTPFPGWTALLPVLGTVAIIVAGTRGEKAWHTRVSSSAPVQWVGDVSYSLYLWHWPLIVVAPFVLGGELAAPSKLGVLAVALVLAGLTKRYVEDPGRRARWWSGSVRRSLLGMGAGMLVVFVIAAGLFAGTAARDSAESRDAPLPAGSCVGPAAIRDVDGCPDAFGPAVSTEMTTKNSPFFSAPECVETSELVFGGRKTTRSCDFSAGRSDAADVWLVGDSHAEHWQGAVFEIAAEHGWRLTISLFGGCPAADVAFVGFRTPASESEAADCRAWSRAVSDRIVEDRPDIVLTSMAARLQLVDDGSGRSQTDQFVAGLETDWTAWTAAGATVIPIGDPPLNGEVRSADCVVLHAADPIECARPRAEAQPADPLLAAAAAMAGEHVVPIDLTSDFCDDASCYAVIGGEPVYFDADHLNLRYVRMLVPRLDGVISAHLPAPRG